MFSIEIDAAADALYVRLKEGVVAGTRELDDYTLVDVDDEGRPLGIEVVYPARHWPLDEFLERFAVDADTRVLLGALIADAGNVVDFPATGTRQTNSVVTRELVAS